MFVAVYTYMQCDLFIKLTRFIEAKIENVNIGQ